MISMLQKCGFTIALIAMISCSGCKNEELQVLAEIPFRVEFEIPAGINVVEDHFFRFTNLLNNYENILTQRGVAAERIQRINPGTARMTVLFDDTPLGFIQEASIYLFSDEVGRQSEAFWTPQIPLNQSSILNIPGTLIDASDFFDYDRIHMEVRLDTRQVPTSFITVRLDVTYHAMGE